MEQTGTIKKILPARSGTGGKSGKPWMAQSFILEVKTGEHGQYKKDQMYEIFGEEKIKDAQLFEGKVVKVSFDIEAHEYEGRWYNSVRAWKVEAVQPAGQAYQQQQQYRPQPAPQPQGYYPQQPYPQQQPQGYYPQQYAGQPQPQGDLPF